MPGSGRFEEMSLNFGRGRMAGSRVRPVSRHVFEQWPVVDPRQEVGLPRESDSPGSMCFIRPAGHLEVGEVCLPELIDGCCLVLERVKSRRVLRTLRDSADLLLNFGKMAGQY